MMTAGSTAETGQGLVMEVACTSRKVVPKRQQPGRPAIFGVRVLLFESQLLEVVPALLRKSRPRPESMRGVLQSHLKAPSSQRSVCCGPSSYSPVLETPKPILTPIGGEAAVRHPSRRCSDAIS